MAAEGIREMNIDTLKFTESYWSLIMKMEFQTLNIIGYFEFHAEILKQEIPFHSLI